jgi:primosomal protein N' (replication factor Y)
MTESDRLYWEVCVAAPLTQSFTYYSVANKLSQNLQGCFVRVPFGKRSADGFVIRSLPAEEAQKSPFEIKKIESIDVSTAKIQQERIQWLQWISEYYLFPIGEVFALSKPPLPPKENQRKSKKPSAAPDLATKTPLILSADQQKVVSAISQTNEFKVHCLFGVTGSGKTEVYMELINKTLSSTEGAALVMVPEISLTPQLIQRFIERFGNQVAVIHSQLTEREKSNFWQELVQKKKRIAIGTRSALFCPIPDLKFIVVDEEHEPSFKQEEKLKYHARDCAIMLAKELNIPIVLGSATPSLETWQNAMNKKYVLHELKMRAASEDSVEVQVLDLKNDNKLHSQKPSWMTEELFVAVKEALDNNQQSALFLNRRGLSQMVMCESCGYVHECPNCDISLTLHSNHSLLCHYCDYTESFKTKCPSCREGELKPFGLGTEQMEKDIQEYFPQAIVRRADRDEVQNRLDMEEIIRDMSENKINILIGTQMIAKGLDFPSLQVVGLVLADIGFNVPDFRATERSFQLTTQMAGRAGRHSKKTGFKGKVFVQTYNPDHPSLVFALKSDFAGFMQQEAHNRKLFNYPPFVKLISIRIQSNDLLNAQKVAQSLARGLEVARESYSKAGQDFEILGPAQSALFKLRNKFRFQILIKGKEAKALNQALKQVLNRKEVQVPGVRIIPDVDPIQMM